MSIPFLWPSIGFASGIALERYSALPVPGVIVAAAVSVPLLCFLWRSRFLMPVLAVALGCSGFFWARANNGGEPDAVERFVGPERVTLYGEVRSLPEVKTRGRRSTVSFVLRSRSMARLEGGRWRRWSVTGQVQVFLIQASRVPEVGDTLRLYGMLSAPRKVLNPGEFDYGEFLAQKKIRALFQVIGPRSVKVIHPGSRWSWARGIAALRNGLASRADRLFPDPQAGIVKALVLGLRNDIGPEVRNQFMKTGTVHLLAISGMNITMIAGTFYVLLLFSGVGFRAASFLTAVIVAAYIGLAGAGIPIQRAGYTAILVLLGTLAGRPTHLLNSLCLSFLVILAWMPQSLWIVGFQLSFLCVLSLILFLPLFSRVSLWTLSLGSSVSVLAGTFPVILYYFNIFSPVSIFANLVAIPLCDGALFTALFALLLGSVPLAGPFFIMVSSGIITGVLGWVKMLSAWRWGYWFLERPALWELGIYYAILGGLLFTYRRIVWMKRFWVGVFVLGWAGISGLMLAGRGGGEFQMTLLAGGRNQVAHARFSNGAHWIFNAGRSFPSDQGEWLIAPYLRTGGIRSLEGIFVSDLSKKNTGGLAALLRDFPVRSFLHPVAAEGATAGFSGMIRKAGGIMHEVRPGDGVSMADEVIRVQACTAKGTALEISTGPWRIVLVSGWDADLFKTLFENGDEEALHAVLLPSPGNNPVPIEFDDWVREARPMLVVSPGSSPRMSDLLERERISFLDPSRVGAVSFLRKGDHLELSSFLKGMLGFFSYS